MDFDFAREKDTMDKGLPLDERIVKMICLKLMEILHTEDNLLVLDAPINIVGDLHGQYEDLLSLFNEAGGYDKGRFLFMGDYVDRGYYSLNTFLLLAMLKIQRPNEVFLLRGNHECRTITRTYGFYDEVLLNYGSFEIWQMVMNVFDLLPLCALVGKDVFSVHGGLSPAVPLISMVHDIYRIQEIPETGPLADLLWSDPAEEITEWKYPNPRGAGFSFGADATKKFCHLNRLRLVTRSHQLAEKGYLYYFKDLTKIPEGRLLLVWSAPNYCYTSGNSATFLQLGDATMDPPQRFKLVDIPENPMRIPRDSDITDRSPYFT